MASAKGMPLILSMLRKKPEAISVSPEIKMAETKGHDILPWVEKYRPTTLDEICGHDTIRLALKDMAMHKRFPHLLLFGPPGTGKTTIAINYVREVHPDISQNMICLHLNASDERGLDTIRTRIRDFVESNLYVKVTPKFVILDEAENMTEQAQMSLRTFLDTDGTSLTKSVCFIFLANHLTKIHPDLLSRFIRFRLSFLPHNIMIKRLVEIAQLEGYTEVTGEQIETNLVLYRADMRHQIQHLQQLCSHPTETKTIDKFLAFVSNNELPLDSIRNQIEIYLEQYELSGFLASILSKLIASERPFTDFALKIVEFREHSHFLSKSLQIGWLARIIKDTLI